MDLVICTLRCSKISSIHTELTAASWMLHVERFEKFAEMILNNFNGRKNTKKIQIFYFAIEGHQPKIRIQYNA